MVKEHLCGCDYLLHLWYQKIIFQRNSTDLSVSVEHKNLKGRRRNKRTRACALTKDDSFLYHASLTSLFLFYFVFAIL